MSVSWASRISVDRGTNKTPTFLAGVASWYDVCTWVLSRPVPPAARTVWGHFFFSCAYSIPPSAVLSNPSEAFSEVCLIAPSRTGQYVYGEVGADGQNCQHHGTGQRASVVLLPGLRDSADQNVITILYLAAL